MTKLTLKYSRASMFSSVKLKKLQKMIKVKPVTKDQGHLERQLTTTVKLHFFLLNTEAEKLQQHRTAFHILCSPWYFPHLGTQKINWLYYISKHCQSVFKVPPSWIQFSRSCLPSFVGLIQLPFLPEGSKLQILTSAQSYFVRN